MKKEITKYVMEYTCSICGQQVTTSDQGELVPLTEKRREINKELNKLFHKRRKSKNDFIDF